MNEPTVPHLACPAPQLAGGVCVTLAHGEGGRLMRQLISEHIVPRLGNPTLRQLGDAAALVNCPANLALTTDSFVVSPLFFPGGDIGSLAVFGTVNDLAVSGARPRWLSVSLILEEGLPLATLDQILDSLARAANQANVEIVAGDTKVVPRGAADGIFITATGLGEICPPAPPGPAALAPGDAILVSGPVGRHGVAVLVAREALLAPPWPASDCGELFTAVDALRTAGVTARAMRDATRGGVAAVLHEWSQACGHSLCVDEAAVPVTPEVRGACELLGLDPLHVANEGTMVVAVPAEAVERALAALRSTAAGRAAAWIGEVEPRDVAAVTVCRALGRKRPLDEPLGAPLPRIC